MTKRVERLLVTSNFLTFAMVIALWIRAEVGSRLEERRFLAFKSEVLGNQNTGGVGSTDLGNGLFPESWRFSPGGLARNYPSPSTETDDRSKLELPSWDTPSESNTEIDDHPTDTTISAGEGVEDLWYRAFTLNKLAEEKENSGDLAEARQLFDDAEFLFHHVNENFPGFHPEIVKRRLEIIKSNRLQLKSTANSNRNRSPGDLEDSIASTDEEQPSSSEPAPIEKPKSKVDPSDVWYRGYMEAKEAEELESQGDLISALNKYNQAEPLFRAIEKEHPNFHHQIVIERLKIINQAQSRIRMKLREQGPTKN